MDNAQPTGNLDPKIQSLERKSLILCRTESVILVLLSGLGLAALLAPDLTAGRIELRIAGDRAWYSLAMLLGLGLVLGLFAFWQQQAWRARRGALLAEVISRDALEKLMLVDPLTGAFNRRYLDEVIAREVSRAERYGSSLTFLKIQVGNLNEARTRLDCGTREGLLKATAGLLRRNLRPTDVVVRFDHEHFMAVMSETSKHGALVAVRRLLECTDAMNLANAGRPGYPLELSYGLADYQKGIDVRDMLAAADHSVTLYQDGLGTR